MARKKKGHGKKPKGHKAKCKCPICKRRRR